MFDSLPHKTHLGKPDVERGARHDAVLVLNHHDVQSTTDDSTKRGKAPDLEQRVGRPAGVAPKVVLDRGETGCVRRGLLRRGHRLSIRCY